jgi:glycosyltransferase involved in cell wall biosynthesis
MHIAMLAPISWPLPPTGYGPWELVASNLTEALVGLGHEVTLFAAGGTQSSAQVVCTSPHALETWPDDERHAHALVFGRLIPCPLVTTLHGSAWVRACHPVLRAYRDLPFVSLSDAERRFLPELNYVATVHNGIRLEEFPYHGDKEDYLLFSGRLAPEKGPDTAIEVARRSGRRLLMAGMIESQYQAFFDTEIKPHLDGGQVEFLGLLSQPQLVPYLQKAAGVLFLGRWAEPFGLSAVEAQACGTPLIATRRGALPEIILEGETGFVVDSTEQAVEAAAKLGSLAPSACRENAERRFSTTVMARGYEAVYAKLIA